MLNCRKILIRFKFLPICIAILQEGPSSPYYPDSDCFHCLSKLQPHNNNNFKLLDDISPGRVSRVDVESHFLRFKVESNQPSNSSSDLRVATRPLASQVLKFREFAVCRRGREVLLLDLVFSFS